MKKFTLLTVGIIASAFILSGYNAFVNSEVAVITKVTNEVTVKAEKGDWKNAKRSDKLSNGDNIKTGAKANAIVKFLDGSILRIRQNSELVVYSDRAGAKIDKKVQVDVGDIGFNVRKQKDENFSFSSPASVATIRGTEGGFGSSELRDYLMLLNGLAVFTNSVTNETIDLSANQIAELNRKTGKVESRNLTGNEKDEFNKDNDDAEKDSTTKKLKLDFKMPDGSLKSLELEYQE